MHFTTVVQTLMPRTVSSAAPAPASTANSLTLTPTAVFVTPALTTIFTPPPECTQDHLTMLENQQYFVWLNEPNPVPNTTFSSCYPPEFMTSYLESKSSTILPAFSPLVCPDNYYTVFNQTVTDRPLYVACCPSNFGFAPPSTSTPGRPAYGGTCYSNILSTTITQYDNSSSSGVMSFTTSGQAYAHPIDGFALDSQETPAANSAVQTPNPTGSLAFTTALPVSSSSPPLQGGAIAGIAIGIVAILLAILAIGLFYLRGRHASKIQNTQFEDAGNSQKDWQQALSVNNKKSAAATTALDRDSGKAAEMGESICYGYARVVELGSGAITELPIQQPPQELDSTPQEIDSKPLVPLRSPAREYQDRTSRESILTNEPIIPRKSSKRTSSSYYPIIRHSPAAPKRSYTNPSRTQSCSSADTNKSLPSTPVIDSFEGRWSQQLEQAEINQSRRAMPPRSSSYKSISPIERTTSISQNPFASRSTSIGSAASRSSSSSGGGRPSPASPSGYNLPPEATMSPISIPSRTLNGKYF